MPRRVAMVGRRLRVAPRYPFLRPTGGCGQTSLTCHGHRGASFVGLAGSLVPQGSISRGLLLWLSLEGEVDRLWRSHPCCRWHPTGSRPTGPGPGQARNGVKAAPAGALL
jgi:hypothetical protein